MQLDLLTPEVCAERVLRNAGMAAAAANADRMTPRWCDRAFEFLTDYVATNEAPFMTEEVRAAAEKNGLPPPPDRRAWGSVTTRAVREGFIKRIGYGPQRAAGCHCAPKSIWKRASAATLRRLKSAA